jgi:hypothetical protein
MNNDASFPFSLDFDGSHYSGTIAPSGETDKYGIPVYYRVMLGDTFFAYLCCGEIGWGRKDSTDEGDDGLIQAIGGFYQGALSVAGACLHRRLIYMEKMQMTTDTFTVTIHMVSSLDGIIAKKDNSVSWFETSDVYEKGVAMLRNKKIVDF